MSEVPLYMTALRARAVLTIPCEDRIGTGPPRARTQVIYVDLGYSSGCEECEDRAHVRRARDLHKLESVRLGSLVWTDARVSAAPGRHAVPRDQACDQRSTHWLWGAVLTSPQVVRNARTERTCAGHVTFTKSNLLLSAATSSSCRVCARA